MYVAICICKCINFMSADKYHYMYYVIHVEVYLLSRVTHVAIHILFCTTVTTSQT